MEGAALMTVHLPAEEATLTSAAQRLGVPVESLDVNFGLVHLGSDSYVVLASGAAPPTGVEAYSNPRIETFGPPSSDED